MIDATMATGSTATPVDEVESLMSEVAEEHGMNLAEQCVQPGPRPAATTHPCSHRALFADSRRWRRREQRRRQSLKRSLPRLRRMSCSGDWKHSNEVEVQELPAVLNTMHSARLSGQLQPANTPSLPLSCSLLLLLDRSCLLRRRVLCLREQLLLHALRDRLQAGVGESDAHVLHLLRESLHSGDGIVTLLHDQQLLPNP